MSLEDIFNKNMLISCYSSEWYMLLCSLCFSIPSMFSCSELLEGDRDKRLLISVWNHIPDQKWVDLICFKNSLEWYVNPILKKTFNLKNTTYSDATVQSQCYTIIVKCF